MSHQDGLGNNGPETTGLSKPDDGDDRMEIKSENVAHARNGIKLNLKNSGRLRNSPTTGFESPDPVATQSSDSLRPTDSVGAPSIDDARFRLGIAAWPRSLVRRELSIII